MSTRGNRTQRVVSATVVAATLAMVAATIAVPFAAARSAAAVPTIDRSPGEAFQLAHQTCSGTPIGTVPTTPVVGPAGVPHGAGSLRLAAGDDAVAEYSLPPVPDAKTLQHYRVTVMDPHGQVHLAAGVQPESSSSIFLTAVVEVTPGAWTVLDLATVTWQHWSNNQIRYWPSPGVTVDASGPLSTWVPDSGTTDFRSAVSAVGCNSDGGIGARSVHLDLSDVAGGSVPVEQSLVDHEPAAAPLTSIAASRRARAVAGQRVRLSTRLTYAAGWPVAGRTVSLEARALRGGPWRAVSSGPTDALGGRTVTVKPTSSTSYRWVFAGDVYFGSSDSRAVAVKVRTRVAARAPASVTAGRRITVVGRTTPRRRGVEVTLWRLGPTRQLLDTATVGRRGRFALQTPPASPGRWTLVVTAARTSTNEPGRSRKLVVTAGR